MSRRHAKTLIRNHGGVPTETIDRRCDLVVLGDDDQHRSFRHRLPQELLGVVKVIEETDLWQQLGLVDDEIDLSRLYTPSMLAQLLNVPISTIRRWHRRGLIHPIRQVQKLPYFDFQQIASARMIARLVSSGMSPDSIERQLAELADLTINQSDRLSGGESCSASRSGGGAQRPATVPPLSQLSIIVEGKNVLLREGGGLVATNGQKHFNFSAVGGPTDHDAQLSHDTLSTVTAHADFEAADFCVSSARATQDAALHTVGSENQEDQSEDGHPIAADPEEGFLLSFEAQADRITRRRLEELSRSELIELAVDAEDDGNEESALEFYRAAALLDGPSADVCFRIAELLYQCGDLEAARERYYMAIELDQNFVEARASLGGVLMELGKTELAIATFRGTLDHHPDFPDVHYHLARLLDETGKSEAAINHWEAFLQLAPKSPWAEEAHDRLEESQANQSDVTDENNIDVLRF